MLGSTKPATGDLAFRKRVSLIRAQLATLMGRPRGFFTQYAYASSIRPVSKPYPEVEQILAASPWRDFLSEMASYIPAYKSFSGPNDPRWGDNRMLSPLDGAAVYTAVKRFKPKRVIEIGSGDSTHFLVKAGASVTCIDPAPRRSIADLGVTFLQRVLSEDDAHLVDELEAGDILFIDSSHIMLPGMDVDIQFNRMFPRLKPGVIVHVHDIFLPDDYPPSWRPRYYSEQNALVGWIVSGFFDVLWSGHYVGSRHGDEVRRAFAGFEPMKRVDAGSIWLRKA